MNKLVTAIVILILLGLGATQWLVYDFTFRDVAFDSGKWISGDTKQRGQMAQSLIDSEVLLGKTSVEVVEVLGKPKNGNLSSYIVYFVNMRDKLFGSYTLNVFLKNDVAKRICVGEPKFASQPIDETFEDYICRK